MVGRVVHLSFSAIGGAGVVARRLVDAQRAMGIDSALAVCTESNLRRHPLSAPRHLLPAVVDEYIVRRPDFPATISLYRDRVHPRRPPELDRSDVIHVHWVNGVIDWTELRSWLPSVPVVWTLHDMNPLTGGCHHSLGCEGFTRSCEECPAVRFFAKPAIAQHHQQKALAIQSIDQVSFVSPSAWLAAQAKASTLLAGQSVRVIPNPLPADLPPAEDSTAARDALGIPRDNVVFVVSATNLDDPLKNVQAALRPLRERATADPSVTVLVAGGGEVDTASRGDVRLLGALDQAGMRQALSAADYVVVTSVAENQPMLVAEAHAAGASLIAPTHTGLSELFESDPDGWPLADASDLESLLLSADGPARKSDEARKSLAQAARERYEASTVASSYLELYQELEQS